MIKNRKLDGLKIFDFSFKVSKYILKKQYRGTVHGTKKMIIKIFLLIL